MWKYHIIVPFFVSIFWNHVKFALCSSSSSDVTSCSFGGDYVVAGSNGAVTLKQFINPDNQTVSVQLTYAGLGWIGMGFVTTPVMVPNTAVIGLPDAGTVAEYNLTAYSTDGVTMISSKAVQAAITDKSITQNSTHTVLQFTQPLVGSGDVSVVQGSSNMFIWAHGSDNTLAYHAARGSDSLTFDVCGAPGAPVPAPVTAPVPAPLTAPIPAPVAAPVKTSNRVERSYLFADGKVVLNILGDAVKKLLTVEMTYAGIGWIAFAISKDGNMPDSTAIIGGADPNPTKYQLTGRSQSAVNPATDQGSLTDTQFVQNDTHTYMKFTKPFVENGDIIVLLDGSDHFLYAFGSSNKLAIHVARSSFVFLQCDASSQNCDASSSDAQEVQGPNHKKWMAHGICMAISWAILIPLGIGSSIIRTLLPAGGLWFQVHRGLNALGVILTICGFSIAVNIFNSDGVNDHFKGNRHQTVGLVVTIFALVQGINGALRPHAPTPSSTNDNHSNDAEAQQDNDHKNVQHHGGTEKTQIRAIWEVVHRLLGLTTVGLAWYNCDTGFQFFKERFGADDQFAEAGKAFWPVVGAISGLIFVLGLYCNFVQKKDNNNVAAPAANSNPATNTNAATTGKLEESASVHM